jgi:hypothetical protein
VKIIESRSHCRGCGTLAILGDGLCDKCWDKEVDGLRGQCEVEKGISPPKAVYYVMRNGKLVETTQQEFWAVVSGIRYHGSKYQGRKAIC